MSFGPETLRIDPAAETDRIVRWLRGSLTRPLRRRGLVLGLSGGVDSSVTAALAARAVGAERTFALMMPERHSASSTLDLGRLMADQLQIAREEEDITRILEAVGFYERYDAAVRRAVPAYGEGWQSKLVTADAKLRTGFSFFSIVARAPDGTTIRERLPLQAYLEIVAATNFKQRIRKMLEYHHADRLNYAVAGTPNRLEYDQGFFVKNGDGAADVKPIAHLYKSQVYQLAEFLGVPEVIRSRPPTTDTYSLDQGQDEFYFSVPFQQMDLCLYGLNHGISVEEVAGASGLSAEQVGRVWADIAAKRSATQYLHLKPLLPEPVLEIEQPAESSGPQPKP